MKSVVMAAAESAPFSRGSGLGEVVGQLCRAHADAGVETTCVIPLYYRGLSREGTIKEFGLQATKVCLEIPLGSHVVSGKVWETRLAGVRYLCIDQSEFFDRKGIYGEQGEDYRDNCERFTFFSRGVLEAIRQLDLSPEVIHCHDWPTGLIPALLEIECGALPTFAGTKSCFTVHDMSYQGIFWHWDMVLTGLDWKYFNWKQMEFFGNLSLLKTGLTFADCITTDSPTYAKEIQTAEHGCGLQGLLRSRRQVVSGILNGLDPEEWDPATDRVIFQKFSTSDLNEGKWANKHAFQKENRLPVSRDALLVGVLGPFTRQSGGELLYPLIERMRDTETQFVLLEPEATSCSVTGVSDRNGKSAVVRGELCETSLRRMLAAADVLVIPQRSQPSGFQAMAAGAYGTIPVAYGVGGIADTVCDAVCDGLPPGRVAGFVFHFPDVPNLMTAVERAREQFRSKEHWQRLRLHAMRQRWEWRQAAETYREIYERASFNSAPVAMLSSV